VVLDYKPPSYSAGPYGGGGRPAKWELSLDIGGEKVSIDDSTNKWEMWSLAHWISQLIGKEMIDRNGKGESRYDPKVSREEIVARWKKRTEQEAEKKKKRGH